MLNRLKLLTQRHRRLLVVEFTGYRLRAALVRAIDDQVVVEQIEESGLADPSGALAEAVEKLGLTDMPRRAILVTPEATPALLELPVDPALPRPRAEMHEMVRWELETQITQQIGSQRIGEILVGRGYLTYEQVDLVCRDVELRMRGHAGRVIEGGSAAGSARHAHRFGETAVELGLVAREALQECLEIQHRFREADEDECVCGWTSQPNHQFGDSGMHRWFACAVRRNLRDRWTHAFEQLGIKLQSIYPLLGCAATFLSETPGDRPTVVVELHTGFLSTTELDHGRVREFRFQHIAEQPPSPETIERMIATEDAEVVWLSGNFEKIGVLSKELASRYGWDVRPILVQIESDFTEKVALDSLAGMVGAARHVFGLCGADRTTCVEAHEPGVPLRKQPRVWGMAAGVTAALGILTSETLLFVKLANASQTKQEALTQLDGAQAEIGKEGANKDRVDRLTTTIESLKSELAEVQRRRTFFERDAVNRGRFLPEFLDAISDAASQHAVVDRVYEPQPRQIHVTGWALSQVAAERFAASLSASLRRWNLVLSNSEVREKPGRLGLDGYSIELHFRPSTPTPLPPNTRTGDATKPHSVKNCRIWEGEAPAEPHVSTMFRLGGSLALPTWQTLVLCRTEYFREGSKR